jgi:hypothetical protein
MSIRKIPLRFQSAFGVVYLIGLGILLSIYVYLCWLMLRICLSYFPWSSTQGFLALKQDVVNFLPWQWAFKVHVASSSLILLAGFSQFWTGFRLRYPKWHRRLGWLYVLAVLGLAAPSGLIMAFYAAGGWLTQLCFVLLSVVWITATILAVYYAVSRRWQLHRHWMIRSFALSLSALSLRSWKLLLYQLAPYVSGLSPQLIYQLEAWLGWLVNLFIAEFIIYYLVVQQRRKTHKNSLSA